MSLLLRPPAIANPAPAHRAKQTAKWRRALAAWFLPAALTLAVLCLYLANHRFLESTDTVGNELLPISILQHGSLTFDQYYAPPGPDGVFPTGEQALQPGSIPDAAAFRVAPELEQKSIPWWFVRVGGHVVSLYPVAPGLLNTPVFYAANTMNVDLQNNLVQLTHITTSLIAALTVLAMYLCLVQVTPYKRTVVYLTLAFALGTAVWSANSRSLYQHGAATLFIAAAFACLLSHRPRLIAVAGLLLALAVATRPADAVLAGVLALYVLRHERRAFPGFALLGAIPILLMTWYSWVYLGTPLALGQGQGTSGFGANEPVIAVLGLLASPNRGLLAFSPIFIFSVIYAVNLVRRRGGPPLLHYVTWSSVALVGLYALWTQWPGGHSYGYRFLIELTPGLMLLLAAAWPRLIEPRPLMRALFMVALLASIYIHGLGADAAPCGFDDEPDNIDYNHARLWDVANGEIARCTRMEIDAWQSNASSI